MATAPPVSPRWGFWTVGICVGAVVGVLALALAFLSDTNAGTVAALAGGAFTAISTIGAAFFGIRVAAETAGQAQQTAVAAQQQASDARQQAAAAEHEAVRAGARATEAERRTAELEGLAREYEGLRRTPSGAARTRSQEQMLRQLRDHVRDLPVERQQLERWLAGDTGDRLQAWAAMLEHERLREFDLILGGISASKSAFEQYYALRLMESIVESLGAEQLAELEQVLEYQTRDGWIEPGTDRRPLAVRLLEAIRRRRADET